MSHAVARARLRDQGRQSRNDSRRVDTASADDVWGIQTYDARDKFVNLLISVPRNARPTRTATSLFQNDRFVKQS